MKRRAFIKGTTAAAILAGCSPTKLIDSIKLRSAWYLVPYLHVPSHRKTGGMSKRVCGMNDFTAQIRASGGNWREVEVLGDHAAVKVVADPDIVIMLNGKFKSFPVSDLRNGFGSITNRQAGDLLDYLSELGYMSDEINSRLGDIKAVNLEQFLRFCASRRKKPRYVKEIGSVILDGPNQNCEDVGEIDKRINLPSIFDSAGAAMMAFPETSLIDDFNSGTNPLSANWTGDIDGGGVPEGTIVSNRCRENDAGNECSQFWNASTFGPDSEIFCETYSADPNIFPYIRLQSPGTSGVDGYSCGIDGGDWETIRVDNAAETVLGAGYSQALSSGQSIGLDAVGNSISAYFNDGSWNLLESRTDSTYGNAGNVGVYIYGANNEIDNFSGGTIPAAGGSRRIIIL